MQSPDMAIPTKNKYKDPKRLKSLSQGRPPLAKPLQHQTLSSKATRTLIRQHHNVLKAHAKALKDGNIHLAEQLSQQLTEDSLYKYQLASKTGQSLSRGGDSSRVLVEWLMSILQSSSSNKPKPNQAAEPLRVLEIGALSTKNAISSHPSYLTITRIDLNSQEKGILKQDFMARPLPQSTTDKFHIISLSLVLNFVSDPLTRGEMLKRCTQFLLPAPASSPPPPATATPTADIDPRSPSLFLVLPLPCVQNSRYLTIPHLTSLMSILRFSPLQQKTTNKLYYSLWRFDDSDGIHSGDRKKGSLPTTAKATISSDSSKFRKKEVLVKGGGRNNFAILLE